MELAHRNVTRSEQFHTENKPTNTSKTPYVAIDERGLVRSIHMFLFSCVH